VGAIRGGFVATVAIPLSLFVWTHVEAATEPPLQLLLYVYDYAGVAPAVRVAAAEVTRHIYAAIGVDIVWVDRCPLACHIAFTREAYADISKGVSLMVTILPDGMTSRLFPADVMGAAPELRRGGMGLLRQNQSVCIRTRLVAGHTARTRHRP
jgi:hypothetical protein